MAWRPFNETDADRERERRVAAALVAAWDFGRVVKLSEGLYHVDYVAVHHDGTLAAWIEIKCRKRAYDRMLLSLSKLMSLYQLWEATGLLAYFVIHLPERGLLAHAVRHPRTYQLKPAGSARGQNGDQEPCALIPVSEFTPVAPELDFSDIEESGK